MATRRTKTTRKNHKAGLYRELEARGYVVVRRKGALVGGVHLRAVKTEMIDRYLGDDTRAPDTAPRRDPRSYHYKNSKGQVCDPILTYWTFVNFSSSYRPSQPPEPRRVHANG